MGSEIRVGQLITPFGPGSIYTDKNGVPTVICGLDHWYKKYDVNGVYRESPDAVKESTLVEPRLGQLIGISCFRKPPIFIHDDNNPGLSDLKVPSHRFPRWYVNNASGKLLKLNLESLRTPKNDGYWKPVRFMAVCSAGHMSDFPWKDWSGCTCNDESGLVLNDSGGVDLGSITIRCNNCKASKSLSGATLIDRSSGTLVTGLSKAGISCKGERPWLGGGGGDICCLSPLAAVMINQSNVYFSNTVSSIFLPDLISSDVVRDIQKQFNLNDSKLTAAALLFKLGEGDMALNSLKEILKPHFPIMPLDKDIMKAYEDFGSGKTLNNTVTPEQPESSLLDFRRSEFNIIRNEVLEGISPELRVISAEVPDSLKVFFDRINLVERLRETKVFLGFDRLERSGSPLDEMPQKALNQLFKNLPDESERWLPAVNNYGEGIYIELSESAIQDWLNTNSSWLKQRYDQTFVSRMANEPLLLPPLSKIDWRWAARYQLVHTLSHLLINQLVFESGYSSAALKERIFVSSDLKAPMAGILIYTASGDSDGSMGGLVRLGRPSLFEPLIRRAISKASWCSVDPICSEDMGGTGSRLVNKAACHACTLLPETACETINNGLDRVAVVGAIGDNPEAGFLSSLIFRHVS